MTLREFIRKHRKELDECIANSLGGPENYHHRNDAERENWIMNDEGLYRWARSEGVKIKPFDGLKH